ncbi:MAG: hypothetical protein SPF30_00565, partial [Arcanobacterium sp.]|nr:hypothetical protein [Arcanobacterium sp.]
MPIFSQIDNRHVYAFFRQLQDPHSAAQFLANTVAGVQQKKQKNPHNLYSPKKQMRRAPKI